MVLMSGTTDEAHMLHDEQESLSGFLTNDLVGFVASLRWSYYSLSGFAIAQIPFHGTVIVMMGGAADAHISHAQIDQLSVFPDKSLRCACLIWVHQAV